MRVKIWGARGSIPTPIQPGEVREKIITALLSISRVEDGDFREELLTAILENPQLAREAPKVTGAPGREEAALQAQDLKIQEAEIRRRRMIETYLDRLSPLAGGTASGNTPCLEVRSGKDLFIVDAGSGIRELGRELMLGECGQGRGVIHLFFSHPHWDHIQGFPFFRPAFIPGNKIFIYGVHDMEAVLRRQQEFINFPVSLDYMQADLTFVKLKPEEVLDFGDLRIRNICNHHPGDSYGFRFEKGNKVFVYSSDASYPAGINLRPFINFFADADLLIYDSQFTQRESDEKEDWGHSSSFVGVEMAQQANVKCLVLFHYDPTYSDKELEKILEDTLRFQQNQYPTEEPVRVLIAQEGQVFDLTPPHTTQVQQVPGGKAVILKPVGVFDEHVAAELREQLLELKKSNWPPQLIIDMSGVEMLQVTGLRALVKLRREQKGVAMALAGPPISVQQLIDLTGYSDFFAIYPSVHAALNALQARETLNLPGQMIKNRYYIEAKLGEGPLGTVFKATDTRLNRPVAIKVLSPAFSEGAIEQFLNQARQIVDLEHPNIVTVYDCDEDRGLSFMVEEFIECQTLQDLMNENPGRPFPLEVALSITESIARALEYAHARGVVHGDLKPKNILLAGHTKISDFGLGRLESGKPLLESEAAPSHTHYLAPEQVLGHPMDARTDLYTLGVILYELFTGVSPFYDSAETRAHHRHSLSHSPREHNPALSQSLEHLILKLLDKDPNRRYATARQVQRILASLAVVTSQDISQRSLVRHRWPALVGRDKAMQRLRELWEETRHGRGQLMLITGEPGMGKTRLTQELASLVDEATLLVGHCERLEGSPAYQPFVGALLSYLAALPAENRAQNPVARVIAEIGRFIPELHQFVPGLASLGQLPAVTSSASGSVAEVIGQATAGRPWLLILDNLQWADQSSLQLLHYLARHCGRMALLIVGTYQVSALESNPFLVEVLNSLSHYISYASVPLEPLSQEETRELLERIWSQPVPPDLAAAVFHRTAGNPFYVEEVARGLADEGVVSWRDGRWYFAPIVEAGLPQRTRDAILRRVFRLSKETQALIHRAAILGHTFKFVDLLEMSSLPERDLLESLDLTLERQFIKASPADGLLRFGHSEIQQVVYDSLSPLKRRLLHREAGEALERSYLPEPEQIAAILAHHFFQAGELEKGLIYSIRAATQADSLYASQDALVWYTQALDALDQLGIDDMTQQQRFELLLAREHIYGHLGERHLQAADLVTLQTMVQSLPDPVRQAVVHVRQARYERVINHFAEAAVEAQAGLIAARQAKNPALEGDCLLQLGYLALNQGQVQLAREHLHNAQQILAGTGDRSRQTRSLNGLGNLYRYLADDQQAQDYYQEALALSHAGGNRYDQAACLCNLGLIHLQAGEYTRAEAYSQQSLEINRAIGDRWGEAVGLSSLALIYKELGHYSLAHSHIKASLPIRHFIQDYYGQAFDLAVLAGVHLAQGNYALARDHAQQALEIAQRLKLPIQEGRSWLELGLALEALGDLPKAGDAYKRAQALQEQLGSETGGLDARAGLARCLLAGGKIGEAKIEIEVCLKGLKAHGPGGLRYPIRLYLAAFWVLQAAGDAEEASATLQEGYNLLQQRALGIKAAALKDLFLKSVPEHKELSIQFAKQQAQETA